MIQQTPGPPPRPTALKLLAGNPGKRPINKAEPQPVGDAEPPEDLSPAERLEWDKLAPILRDMRVLTIADGPALAYICRDIVQERTVAAAIANSSLVVKQASYIGVNPLWAIQTELRKRIWLGLREFGMTSASRSRLTVEKPGKKSDPWNLM